MWVRLQSMVMVRSYKVWRHYDRQICLALQSIATGGTEPELFVFGMIYTADTHTCSVSMSTSFTTLSTSTRPIALMSSLPVLC